MKRAAGFLFLAQALVYGGGAFYLGQRWWPLWLVLGAAALGQALAGGWLVAGRGARWVRPAAGISLAAVALVIGLYLQIGLHAISRFAEVGQGLGWGLLGGVVAALPWLVAVPLWQLVSLGLGRRGVGGGAALLLAALVLPPLALWVAQVPTARYPAQDGAAVATWLESSWRGAEAAALPVGPGPALLVVTEVAAGERLGRQVLEGADLTAALESWSPPAAPAGGALLVEIVRAERRLAGPWLADSRLALLPVGAAGLRTPRGIVGADQAWTSKAQRRGEVGPGLRIHGLDLTRDLTRGATRSLDIEAWIATDGQVSPLLSGWAAPPALSADSVAEAALAGARMVARNQAEDGRYAYLVKGPSGDLGKGYNYPRHAGTTWFLARAASRFHDPELARAARRGIDHLGTFTQQTGDGRGFVLDPSRKDGKAWVGTTALALLAVLESGERPDLARLWGAQVVSSVDAEGLVRGNFDIASGSWPVQRSITYGQGQALLGVAAAARAGQPGAREALERAADAWERAYWPMPAGHLFALGEHWSCTAALLTEEVLGRPAGWGVCEAYLGRGDVGKAVLSGPMLPVAGALGGDGEAIVARAERDRRRGVASPWRAVAERYGRIFLANAYRPADAPLLGHAERLLGGFRDNPLRLDVQVDAVQHIGCALLGLERLLRGEATPGGAP